VQRLPYQSDERLERVLPLGENETIAFIGGTHHIETFHRLLIANGFMVAIICEDLKLDV
jgi:hypothetical protein